MKEFGLYTIKQSYIDKFSLVDPGIADLKGTKRPFVCVKDRNGRNWLVPLASINPNDASYAAKMAKYRDFLRLDKQQAEKDNNPLMRAIHVVEDLTGLHAKGYYSVIEYYNAIPVKHKYCKKYRDSRRQQIIVSDKARQRTIKKVLKLNLAERSQGRYVGFIKNKISNGYSNFETYSKQCIEIRSELYKDHTKRLRQDAERKEVARQRAEEKQRKKELRQMVRRQTAISEAAPMSREQQIAALISVCKQRITSEIDRDQTRERQAEQARQVGQAKPTGAKAPGGKAKGKAPRGK